MNTDTTPMNLCLTQDDRSYLWFARGIGRETHVAVDGEQLAQLTGGWFVWDAPTPPDCLIVYPPERQLVGYKLKPGINPSEAYPAALTPSDATGRTAGEEDLEDIIAALYDDVYLETPGPVVGVPAASFTVADGAPPPDDGYKWYARVPWQFTHQPQLHHLFPGNVGEIGELVKTAIIDRCKRPGGKFDVYNQGGKVTVYKDVPYDEPVEYRDGRKRKTARSVLRSYETVPPRNWPGSNRAEAAAGLSDYLDRMVAEVDDIGLVLCHHCKGTGQIDTGKGR